LRRRIERAFDACAGEIPLEKLRHACCDVLLKEKQQAGASKSILRHIEQQASILEHMARSNLLKEPDAAFVELGAGRGMLSLALAQLFPAGLFVLVDRAHTRGKADNSIGSEAEGAEAKKRVVRAKIDIRHLNLAGMDEIRGKPVVCMSKHLCGVATDLSLRAIAQTLPDTPASDPPAPTPDVSVESVECGSVALSISSAFSGLAIALCCHHVCAWQDYINPEFFLAQGFTPHEFELLTGMTSWTTCGMGLEGDAVEFTLGIRYVTRSSMLVLISCVAFTLTLTPMTATSKSDRAALGRKCKRILDAGRAAYLAQFQLKTRLVHYCEEEDSLENCLLLAYRETS
jgi:tRNA:m4X modification enzyme